MSTLSLRSMALASKTIHYLKRLWNYIVPIPGFVLRIKYTVLRLFCSKDPFDPHLLGLHKNNLIFVCGPPRSGTTMLQSALMRHPEVCGFTSETNIFSRINIYRSDFSPLSSDFVRKIFYTSSSIANAYQRLAREICDQQSCTMVSEKTPQHCLVVFKILSFFPDARFIFIIRNPFSCVSSMINNSSFIPQGSSVVASLDYWVRSVSSIRTFVDRHPTNSLLLKYEQICENPESCSEAICSFLSISSFNVFSAQNINLGSTLHSFSGKVGFMGINKPPSLGLSSSHRLDSTALCILKDKLAQLPFTYEQL